MFKNITVQEKVRKITYIFLIFYLSIEPFKRAFW